MSNGGPVKKTKKEKSSGLTHPQKSLQAKDLKSAVANLNERVSLRFDQRPDNPASASASFYVDRPDNPMEELKTVLLSSPGNDKILFTGHIGCGKSTELNRFAVLPDIQDKFFIIKFPISDLLNIIDIDYIDFLLSFAAFLYIDASDRGIKFSSRVLDSLQKWVNYTKDDIEGLEENAKDSVKKRIYGFFKRVSVILLRELSLRDTARAAIKRNINGLVAVIDTLVNAIASQLEDKELLVIIDDLEKIPDIEKAEELFVNAGTYMVAPPCKIIYTVPIALYYSIRFNQLINTFGNSCFLPNIKVREKGGAGEIDPSGCMKAFLEKRIDMGLIDKDAADMMIENSAGVARELVRMLKNACVKAISNGEETIGTDTVISVIQDIRNEYDRGLEKRHMEVLRAVERGEEVDDRISLMELFHAKVLVEYKNGDRWTAVNPIVKPLLK